jgi:hypothetical protein
MKFHRKPVMQIFFDAIQLALWKQSAQYRTGVGRIGGCEMGEIIKKLGTLDLADGCLDVELNTSTTGTETREIHLQNTRIRICIPEYEFLKMAGCLLLARRQLELIKGLSKFNSKN